MTKIERRATKQRAVEKDKAVAKLLTDDRYCTGCGENYKLSKLKATIAAANTASTCTAAMGVANCIS